eukprot:GHVU01121617.1.p1 GENE.GHVU01121617.1~~GHVU01121617.1.p1  ORF type:complete len:107 (-),score=5.58 GHVU01121617.1:109-429(-)
MYCNAEKQFSASRGWVTFSRLEVSEPDLQAGGRPINRLHSDKPFRQLYIHSSHHGILIMLINLMTSSTGTRGHNSPGKRVGPTRSDSNFTTADGSAIMGHDSWHKA